MISIFRHLQFNQLPQMHFRFELRCDSVR